MKCRDVHAGTLIGSVVRVNGIASRRTLRSRKKQIHVCIRTASAHRELRWWLLVPMASNNFLFQRPPVMKWVTYVLSNGASLRMPIATEHAGPRFATLVSCKAMQGPGAAGSECSSDGMQTAADRNAGTCHVHVRHAKQVTSVMFCACILTGCVQPQRVEAQH